MSEVRDARDLVVACSVVGEIGVAISAERVARVGLASELAEDADRIDAASVLGCPGPAAGERRTVTLVGDGPTVVLGPQVELKQFAAASRMALPPFLAELAARQGWLAVLEDDGRRWLLLEPGAWPVAPVATDETPDER